MAPQDLLFTSLLLLSFQGFSCHIHTPKSSNMFKFDHVLTHRRHQRVFNVDDYGAKARGTDDTKAFMNAWKEACSSDVSALYLASEKKTYLLKPLSFNGPCKSNVTVMIKGTLEASSNRRDWGEEDTAHWILFDSIQNLTVCGGGTIIGNGKIWWENSCKNNNSLPCTVAPTESLQFDSFSNGKYRKLIDCLFLIQALTFYSCKELRVENLNIKDAQQIHVSVEQSRDVTVSKLMITAPKASPNTDGIHVSNTKNMLIKGCVIQTGDDCISIVSGSHKIRAMDIVCGPGHGISIGSLGANKSQANVSDVIVDSVTFNGTANGVRIKTWQGGHGHAKDILFKNITMHHVYNPIIIDQNYCDSMNPCHEQKSAVSVSRVIYKNIKGTSASKVAVTFNCSRTLPCRKIKMQNITLVGEDGRPAQSLCRHVKWTTSETVVPPPCI